MGKIHGYYERYSGRQPSTKCHCSSAGAKFVVKRKRYICSYAKVIKRHAKKTYEKVDT
jgi:hypothetical protein